MYILYGHIQICIKTKIRKYISSVLFLSLLISLYPVKLLATDNQHGADRLYGQDRIATALAVCEQGWAQTDSIVLAPANQENLADAVIALSLAGQEKAPILLTDKHNLDAGVLSKIIEKKARKVYAVGALSDELIGQLRSELTRNNSDISIEVLKGKERQETAALINRQVKNPQGTFIIGNTALSDALSAGPYAYANIFTFSFNSINNAYLIGGQALPGNNSGLTRIAGRDRYETNRLVNGYFGFNTGTIYIASGADANLADALAGAALAGKTGSPIYLTDKSGQDLSDLLREKINGGSKVVILGGPSALPEETKKRIMGLEGWEQDDKSPVGGSGNHDSAAENSRPLQVSSLKGFNLLQFTVEFNKPVNKESSENAENYILNGRSLANATAVAELQADNRTVVITLNTLQRQYSKLLLEVKEHKIFSADRKTSLPGFAGYLTFSDIKAPVIEQIILQGSRKLTVRFSEAVSLSNTMMDYRHWLLDGQGITTKGLQSVKIIKELPVNGQTYGSGLELNFGVSMGQGSHVLRIPSTEESPGGFGSNLFVDGAGYRLSDQFVSFTVQGVIGNSSVKVAKTEGSTLYLEFDRPMYSHPQGGPAEANDPASVLNVNNYTVNNSGSVLAAEFVPGSERRIVKLDLSSQYVAVGLNTITLNKRIEDLYGFRLADAEGEDIRLLFTAVDEKVKPQVENVTAVSPTVIRITFSEKVNGQYAMNKGNYLLKNGEGVTVPISSITAVPGANDTVIQGLYPCTNVYEIHPSQPLYGTGYSLKINYIQDLALRPNTMEETVWNFAGRDNSRIRVREVIGEQGSHRLVVFFSEVMNESSILDRKNYLYKDGDNPSLYRPLPEGTLISAGPENRSAVLEFPAAYRVDADGNGIPGYDVRYQLTALQVINLKDAKGYSLEGGFSLSDVIPASASAYQPGYIPDSLIVREENDDTVKVEFRLDQVLESFNYQDFQAGAPGNKVTADYGYLNGRKVTLAYTDPAKISAIRSLGKDLRLYLNAGPQSANIAGVKPAVFPAEGYQVYDDQVRPRVLNWSLEETAGDDYVLVTFSEAIDGTVGGLYEGDFIFYYGGTDVKVNGVRIYTDGPGNPVPNVLVFDLADGDYTRAGMSIRMIEEHLSIRDVKDRKGGYNLAAYREDI